MNNLITLIIGVSHGVSLLCLQSKFMDNSAALTSSGSWDILCQTLHIALSSELRMMSATVKVFRLSRIPARLLSPLPLQELN